MSPKTENPNPKEEKGQPPLVKRRKRNLPGTPDPTAEVIALSPKTLLSASSFLCEVCNKEFRREQNLQIHRRGHNLPWKPSPKPPSSSSPGKKKKRAYVCPEAACVYHDPARALGHLTGIKKHYSRKHCEKTWACPTCSKRYAVRTDWKAHSRLCGDREYECGCGTLFSRRESFLVHRAACGAGSASAAAAEKDSSGAVDSVGPKASAVNSELLFPSLWGKSTEPESAELGAAERAKQYSSAVM